MFLHDGRKVFVTFAAGVALRHAGQSPHDGDERADLGLHEGERTEKNRTCPV